MIPFVVAAPSPPAVYVPPPPPPPPPPPLFSLSGGNYNVAGASGGIAGASITILGGTPPYTIQWALNYQEMLNSPGSLGASGSGLSGTVSWANFAVGSQGYVTFHVNVWDSGGLAGNAFCDVQITRTS